MSTLNNNFEKQFKKQIDEREIAPSRDLWSDIQEQTTVLPKKKSNLSWVLAAACLVLTMSIGYVLLFNSETKKLEHSAIAGVKTKVLDKEEPQVTTQQTQNIPTDIKTTENLAVETKIQPKKTVISSLVVKEDSKTEELNAQTAPKIIQEISKENLDNKMVAKTDSAKVPNKKRKYVDPATLLFSVENKDAIEKTKGGSNVATIDLNKK